MDPVNLSNLVQQHGLGVALAIGVFALAYLMMKHIIKNSDSVLQAYRQDQQNWSNTINNHLSGTTKALYQIADRLDAHEIHAKHSRDDTTKDHEQMIKAQNTMLAVFMDKK